VFSESEGLTPERSFATLGQNKRSCENAPRQDPPNHKLLEKNTGKTDAKILSKKSGRCI